MAAAKKSSEKGFVFCMECRHATFMQWFENPVITQCHVHNERFVAQSNRNCKDFEPSNVAEPEIQHFDSYDI